MASDLAVISSEDRTPDFLKKTVSAIVHAIKQTELYVCATFDLSNQILSEDVYFITTEELRQRYPNLTPKERENAIVREHHTVFLMQIGDKLGDGTRHDGRAPDYDDWTLNGDILIYYPLFDSALELSSMGIRVDAVAMETQLEKAGCPERKELVFHKSLLAGELPLTIGGGIGQSRLCMAILQRAHIGEVQASIWPEEMRKICAEHNIHLL